MVREWPDTRHVYYGTTAERLAFPAAGEAPGALFGDYDDGILYKWNGAAWVAMATIVTPPADHTHAGAGTGGQLDWDVIWIDAVHDHSAAGEGGQNLHAIAELEFEDPTELTIVGGAITRTQVYHTIAPETGSSDILTTINGGAIGDKLIIRPKLNTILHVQSDIVNIHLSYVGFDYEMTNVGNKADHLELTFDGNVWAGGGAVDPIPSGVDPVEHSHSKLVATDGVPDGVTTDAAGAVTIPISLTLAAGATANEFSTDGTLAGNSDTALPTEKAVKTYVDAMAPGWTAWTPTVTQSGAVAATVTVGRYKIIDGIAFVEVYLDVTAAGTGGNAIKIGGQPAAIQKPVGSQFFAGIVVDTGVSSYYGAVYVNGATDWEFIDFTTKAFIGVNPNFALANGDNIQFRIQYGT